MIVCHDFVELQIHEELQWSVCTKRGKGRDRLQHVSLNTYLDGLPRSIRDGEI